MPNKKQFKSNAVYENVCDDAEPPAFNSISMEFSESFCFLLGCGQRAFAAEKQSHHWSPFLRRSPLSWILHPSMENEKLPPNMK